MLGLSLLLLSLCTRAQTLPRPDGLAEEIGFWRRIFVDFDSRQGVIHDDRHLDVIYGTIALRPEMSARSRRAAYRRAATRYQSILTTLANGKREGLSDEEASVLALWPEDVSDATLRAARDRLRMQQGLADRFRDGFVRSGRWLDHIQASLDAAGVPRELAALPHVESSFNPDAYSHVGASGMWQFTRSTGRRFMRVDHVVDERRDPFLSTEAATQLLQYNHSILQSWPLAITAYNHGVAGMRRAVKQLGTDDIEQIIRHYRGRTFGFASRNFYVAFLAAAEIEQNPEHYLGPLRRADPEPYQVVRVPDYLPAETLGDALGLPLTSLQAFNAALMPPVWDGSKHIPRGYALRLPGGQAREQAEVRIAAIPPQQRFAEQTPDKYHKIRRGDTVSGIAARYNTTVRQLVALNGLDSRHRIRAGRTLRLPYREPGEPVQLAAAEPAKEDAASSAADSFESETTVEEQISVAAAPPATIDVLDSPENSSTEAPPADAGERLLADPSNYLVSEDGHIEVQAEETLGHYADWLEIRTQRLRDLNGYAFGRPVIIGERVKLDFSRASAEQFGQRRLAHHAALQEAFFTRYRIQEEIVHEVRAGDSLWELTQIRYKLPLWLLRQYNPDLDLDRLQPGTRLLIPRLQAVREVAAAPNLALRSR